jgi:L-iditol 2-dehydrogenase
MNSKTNHRWLIKSHLEFRREEAPLEPVPSKDYLVRVDTCGLCRTDLHFATGWAHNWECLGHEFGGTVVAARREDGMFSVGDRVAVKNAAACMDCEHCKRGRYRECTGLITNRDGFSEYSDCDERSLVLATGLDDDLLSLVEPVNVVLDLLHSAELERSDRILVLGAGTLGFLASQVAMHHFNVQSIAIAGRKAQLDGKIDYGAARYLNMEQIKEERWDCVLVTTPPVTLPAALDACAHGGKILTVGLAEESALAAVIDIRTLIFKRAVIRGVFSVPNLYFDEAVSVLLQHGDTVRQVIRRHIPAAQLESWFREWNARTSFDGKAIVDFKEEACSSKG